MGRGSSMRRHPADVQKPALVSTPSEAFRPGPRPLTWAFRESDELARTTSPTSLVALIDLGSRRQLRVAPYRHIRYDVGHEHDKRGSGGPQAGPFVAQPLLAPRGLRRLPRRGRPSAVAVGPQRRPSPHPAGTVLAWNVDPTRHGSPASGPPRWRGGR